MARIAPQSLIEVARSATAADAEALFISCTTLRAASMIPEMERTIGRPIVSSNLATSWSCVRLCGDCALRPQLGALMATQLEGKVG